MRIPRRFFSDRVRSLFSLKPHLQQGIDPSDGTSVSIFFPFFRDSRFFYGSILGPN